MAYQHAISKIASNIKVLIALHEFVRFSDKKTTAIRSRRFYLDTRLAAKILHHLPHYDGNANQAEPEEEQGSGFGGGNKLS